MKARVTQATWSTETPFFHQCQQAVGGHFRPPETAMQPLSASCRQSSGVKDFQSGCCPTTKWPGWCRCVPRPGAQGLGRCSLVDQVEAGVAGFFDDAFDAVDQRLGAGGVVAADVVEVDVAEAAFLPVAAVGDGEFVPVAVRPQPVHGLSMSSSDR